ncbi:cytochrome c oxidase assembly protein [Blastococcus sp. TF02A-26]|uniref:cytochrome c oxidase assembly protein n=1 Tax=Blastococcus sp. TF02A-26 TaxID=2250577 RepID=UPI000DE99E4D|nr:cytochrome c oxidase assembly protein [Blastococcus sp. TF02A-26]RBY83985.1 cytochrome c oxidase assembly protein [Blastococcus sp. TF02A-26]
MTGALAAGWLAAAGAVLLPAALYLAGVGVRRDGGRDWPAARTASWLLGCLLVGTALSPPVETAGTGATGHMVQHLLLGAAAPLALVLGAPMTLLLGALGPAARRPVAAVLHSRPLRLLAHPATGAVLATGGLHLLYLTPLHALSTRSDAVHALVHGHLLVAGCLFAWSVAGPDPAPRRPGTGVRVAVVVAAGGAHAVLAQLLYARAGALPPGAGLDAEEVRTAAQVMYHGGHLVDLALLVALFGARYRRGRRRETARAAGADVATLRAHVPGDDDGGVPWRGSRQGPMARSSPPG